jgi:RNase P/RNase MRP subunit p29
MKIQIAFLALGLTSFSTIATETNWVVAAPQFREINGQLYNTDLSKKFQGIEGTVIDVSSNFVVLEQESTRSLYVPWQGTVVTVNKTDFVVTNFPISLDPTVGANNGCRAMRIGTINYNGQVLKLYDYGTPHRVMVITTNSISENKISP